MDQLLTNCPLNGENRLTQQNIIVDILFTDRSIKADVKVVNYAYKNR